MDKRRSYVIIGNGIAGVTAAEILRTRDPDCALTIVADDPFPVYYRPALKDFLGGHLSEEKLWARQETFYQEQDIRFIPARVVGINPQRHAIQLHNGKTIQYDRLLLANGARPRTLACAGLTLAGVFTLRTVIDYQQVMECLAGASRVVVCGSGTLALESAETLARCGYQVSHLLRGRQLWSEVLDPVASDMVLHEERRAGIEVRVQEEVAEILGSAGEVCGVLTTRGERIPCELVLIAIGIEPAIDWIRASGITCGRGVRVDNAMRTSSPDIYAAGDVIETIEALSGRTRVLGQWFPAIQQAQIAAHQMIDAPSNSVGTAVAPFYNATFLHGLDFVSIGLTTCPAAPGFQEVVAEPRARSYRKVILRNGRIVGALLLGERGQGLALKRALDHQVNLAPLARQLFAEDFDLAPWLDQQGVPAPLLTPQGMFGSEGTDWRSTTVGEERGRRQFQKVSAMGGEKRAQVESRSAVVGLAHRSKLEPLAEARLQFEIEMCIGCNRCMDACPVPSSSQMSIATLNHATFAETIAPDIARFTHECIMCGSCVPVCPVDNHRDLLMLSLKQRLGPTWENQPNMLQVAQAIPAGWSLPQLLQCLREQSILRNPQEVPDTYLLHIIAASRALILKPGETLLREGEYGRALFLILAGQLELTTVDLDTSEIPLAILRHGEYAGEDGLLTGQPYKASARAQGPALLFQVPEQVVQRLIELVPGVRQHFERATQAHSLQSILKRMELCEGLAEADLQALTRHALMRQYERGERLFAEDKRGRPPRETLHILLEGFVKVARQTHVRTSAGENEQRIIAYRQGGDYFAGGLDLLGDGQAVTVTTINRCRVAEVPRQVVLALFQRYPAMEQRFAQRLRAYLEAAAATQVPTDLAFAPGRPPADPAVQDGLHALVSDGVVEGTEVLIIDLDRCIHCNECEAACERRHGHSRMNRKGMVVGNISIANACRQCQDPVCMLCSRAGIARHANGEVYITESCIGCGICVERCPYGAISLVQVEDEMPAGGSWPRFGAWFARNAGTERTRRTLPMINPAETGGKWASAGPLDIFPVRGGYDELRKKIAIKCDLCAGYRDQACIQACPTGAALRVRPADFFGSTEEILRRQVK
jgi:NADPH-dependent 2,4-dienoyl-CoA reductase/sulfur reductase-like enzyme/Fe-S-cluster-containing hydrogenase component 2/CRP-like cAMP-binding protein